MVDCTNNTLVDNALIQNTSMDNTSDTEYGYFDDNAREFVITNPKTPYPWINYLVMKGSIRLYRIRPVVIVFTRMQSFVV